MSNLRGSTGRGPCYRVGAGHDGARGSGAARTVAVACLMLPGMVAASYGQPPCAAGEVQGEMQGAPGYLCAPRCDPTSYSCPTDVPYGTSAQPQCMLQDVNSGAFCGLLCEMDSQCPSGSRCRKNDQMGVSVCIFPVSFSEWAHAGLSTKFAIGWPSQPGGGAPANFQISKTFSALQALKRKYSIGDGDADMLVVKEFLSSLSATAPAASGSSWFGMSSGTPAIAAAVPSPPPAPASQSSATWDFAASKWTKDIADFERDMLTGVPGIQKEISGIAYDLEHLDKRGVCCELLRGVILYFLLYLGLGALIKSQLQGARGLDMVPHIGFWSEYPKLVADGITYSQILVGGLLGKQWGGALGAQGGRSGTGYFETL